MTATASNTTTTSTDGTAALVIAHLVSSVIYHEDRVKEKCDLQGGRRQGFVKKEVQGHCGIELNDASFGSPARLR